MSTRHRPWIVTWTAVLTATLVGAAMAQSQTQLTVVATGDNPQWIWSPNYAPNQAAIGDCFFRKTIELRGDERASVEITCDNRYELHVNGQRVGVGADWMLLDSYDVSALLRRGRNAIAVRATNEENGPAGLVARVTLSRDGASDASDSSDGGWKTSLTEFDGWTLPTFDDSDWRGAHPLGPFGRTAPWGNQTRSARNEAPGRFKHAEEFLVERVAGPEQSGSLVAMTFNEWGDIIASQEQGPLLLIRDEDENGDYESVTTYCDLLQNSQGLLALNGQIFAIGDGPQGTGFYRLIDANSDRHAEAAIKLIAFKGGMGEHGPHAARLGPDGLIYLIVGNHASVDAELEASSPYRHSYEGDLIQPRYEDAGGHAHGVKAPGGVIIRTDPDGSFVEVFAGGLRNAYDIAFNRQGELFTYDSDMEWDEGLPWYRPTRINHVIAGAEFGWRSGWAKWPTYYLDSLPGVLDVGRGSPTGVEVYDHYKYPLRYQDAMFVGDWTRGRILAVRLDPKGGAYEASAEVFIEGRPLNVTDLAVGPDGWLYFSTGGRGAEGGVYRVVWKPDVPPRQAQAGVLEAIHQPQLGSAWGRNRIAVIKGKLGDAWDEQLVAAAEDRALSTAERLRAVDLMQLFGPLPTVDMLIELTSEEAPELRAKAAYLLGIHADRTGDERLVELLSDPHPAVRRTACESLVDAERAPPVDRVLALLAEDDRFVAWAARRLLMSMPREQWERKVVGSSSHRVFVQGATALLSLEPDRLTIDDLLNRSRQLMRGRMTDPDFLDLLRVIELAFIQGQLERGDAPQLADMLSVEYPSLNADMNRELIRLLVYLDDASLASRIVGELKRNGPFEEKLHAALLARFIDRGWTAESKLAVIDFYEQARTQSGGHSYARYIDVITGDFVAKLADDERNIVLSRGRRWPNAALHALRSLKSRPDREMVVRLVNLDKQLQQDDADTVRQLRTGIVAMLAVSGESNAMSYLRQQFESDPERRADIAMGLAQQPDGENWPLLVRSLNILEGEAAREVLSRLAAVAERPTEPEPVRQAILLGLRLGEPGAGEAIKLLEHWTGALQANRGDSWELALAAWQRWFAETYPAEPSPTLPVEPPGSRWTFEQLTDLLNDPSQPHGDAVRGSAVFDKALCAKCHRFGGRGEGVGPDLSTVSLRFQKKEILESLLFPSHVISDQYASKTVQTIDGRTYTGLVGAAAGDEIVVLQSNAEKVVLPKDRVAEIGASRISAMPEGLLNKLTLDEIADLFAYLNQTPTTANLDGVDRR